MTNNKVICCHTLMVFENIQQRWKKLTYFSIISVLFHIGVVLAGFILDVGETTWSAEKYLGRVYANLDSQNEPVSSIVETCENDFYTALNRILADNTTNTCVYMDIYVCEFVFKLHSFHTGIVVCYVLVTISLVLSLGQTIYYTQKSETGKRNRLVLLAIGSVEVIICVVVGTISSITIFDRLPKLKDFLTISFFAPVNIYDELAPAYPWFLLIVALFPVIKLVAAHAIIFKIPLSEQIQKLNEMNQPKRP